MLQSLLRLAAGQRYRTSDLIGILLVLAVGIIGQFILFDPLKFLAPSLPMLSPSDWPGSQYNTETLIMDSGAWSQERRFLRSIVLIRNNKPVAEATQVIAWYANPSRASAAWEQHKSEPYYDFPIVASNTDPDRPASLLFCSTPEPDIQGECGYRAYWRHWYTEVTFYGGISDDFPRLEMEKIIDRIDEHLMSAPDKPCQGFSCTERGRNQIRLVGIFGLIMMMLLSTLGIFRSRIRMRKEVRSGSLTENLPIFLPEAAPKEFISPSSAPEVAIPFSEARLENTPLLIEISINLRNVLVMAFVMLGLILAPLYFYIWSKDFHNLSLEDWYWVIIIVTIGIMSGGILGVRILQASWRQVVVASLCAGAGMMLLSRFEFAPFYPGPWDNSGRVFIPRTFLIGTCLFSAPVFLLPLFEPVIRQKGPAPSTWKVALTALCLSFLVVLPAYVSSVRRDSGWSEQVGYALLWGILLSALLIDLGLILALFDRRTAQTGPWMGGVGILLAIFLLTIWSVLGIGWLP